MPPASQNLYLNLAARGGIADSAEQLHRWCRRTSASVLKAAAPLIRHRLLRRDTVCLGFHKGTAHRFSIPEELRP